MSYRDAFPWAARFMTNQHPNPAETSRLLEAAATAPGNSRGSSSRVSVTKSSWPWKGKAMGAEGLKDVFRLLLRLAKYLFTREGFDP